MAIKVFLVIYNNRILKDGLEMIIEKDKDINVIGEANEEREILKKCNNLTPDVILIDISSKQRNYIYAISIIKEKYPDINVIAIGDNSEVDCILKSLKSGASSYISKKSYNAEEVIKGIKMVDQGKLFLPPETDKVLIQNYINMGNNSPKTPLDVLSQREEEVLKFIADGYTSKQIADKLSITKSTVKTYRQRLKDKFFPKSLDLI